MIGIAKLFISMLVIPTRSIAHESSELYFLRSDSPVIESKMSDEYFLSLSPTSSPTPSPSTKEDDEGNSKETNGSFVKKNTAIGSLLIMTGTSFMIFTQI